MPTKAVTLTMRTARAGNGVRLLVLKKLGAPAEPENVEDTSTATVLAQKEDNVDIRTALKQDEAQSKTCKPEHSSILLT